MMIVWTLVLVLSTSPHVQISLIAEFRSETQCNDAIKIIKQDKDIKADARCLAFAYEII